MVNKHGICDNVCKGSIYALYCMHKRIIRNCNIELFENENFIRHYIHFIDMCFVYYWISEIRNLNDSKIANEMSK